MDRGERVERWMGERGRGTEMEEVQLFVMFGSLALAT